MFKISALLAVTIVLCDSAKFLEKINKNNKCSIKDDECMGSIYRGVVEETVEHGIPEMDIPALDPLLLKYLELNALGLIKVTATDGVVKGLKNCYGTLFKNDLEARRTAIEYVCDILKVEGNYQVESSQAFLALTGGINVHGNGEGSVVIEKLKINLNIAYEVKKHADCELYFELKPEESSYTFDILGKVKAKGGNVYVGKQDISKVALNIFNENWKIFMKIFGKEYFDKGIELFFDAAQKFFANVAIKELVNEDLSAYVR